MRFSLAIISSLVLAQAAYASSSESASHARYDAASASASVSKNPSFKWRNRAAARFNAQNASRSASALVSAHVTSSGEYNNYKRGEPSASAVESAAESIVAVESFIVANVESQIEASMVRDEVFAAIDESLQAEQVLLAPIVGQEVAYSDVDDFWIADAHAEAQFKGYDWKANN